MRKALTGLALSLCCLTSIAQAEPLPVGMRDRVMVDSDAARPLTMRVWYPTVPEAKPADQDQRALFYGFRAALDAPLMPGRHPLVLLSHGYGGNVTNQGWLAVELAARGAVVAAVNHPGTTTADLDSPQTAQLWQRPRDLGRMIDYLTGAAPWRDGIDGARISAIGHSLGGFSVLAAAGARIDLARFLADCAEHPRHADCLMSPRFNLDQEATRQPLEADLRDRRIRAIVALDTGLARAFVPGSLADLPVPALVIAAGAENPMMPAALMSRPLAVRMPPATTRYLEIADAGHFSFLPVCKPGAAAILTAEGEPAICADGGGRDRVALHRQIADAILVFLDQTGQLPR